VPGFTVPSGLNINKLKNRNCTQHVLHLVTDCKNNELLHHNKEYRENNHLKNGIILLFAWRRDVLNDLL